MTETNFTIQWLEERFRFDSIARNEQVEKACLAHLQDKNNISLLDIGSGTGASCIYFMEKMSANQIWTLVELNQELAKASLERIATFASQQDYIIQKTTQQVFLQRGQKFITVKVLQQSFLELEDTIDFGSIDLVTATAVFDLLTKEMFEQFIKPLVDRKIPLLATINYENMSILPAAPQNNYYTDLYTSHMKRPQAFGTTMGGDIIREVQAIFQERNITYHLGESNWKITPQDKKMLQYLLNYMEDAIPELLKTPAEKTSFKNWLEAQRIQKKTSIVVRHWDFFMYF